ncbi:MAG: hypothetical protein ACLTY5_07925 [Angelakisella sp.]
MWLSDSLALYGDSFYWLTIEANKETGERELLLLKYDCATLEKTTVFTEPCEYWADNSQLAIDDEWAIAMYLLSRIPNMRSAGTPLPMKRTTP